MKCIEEFWEGVDVNRDKVALSADETIAIFIFVIVKARIKDLASHLFLIEVFCNEYTLFQTNKGFTFISLMQAADYLKDIDEAKIKIEEKYLSLLIERKRVDLQKRHQQYLNTTLNKRDMSFNVYANPREMSLINIDPAQFVLNAKTSMLNHSRSQFS